VATGDAAVSVGDRLEVYGVNLKSISAWRVNWSGHARLYFTVTYYTLVSRSQTAIFSFYNSGLATRD